MQFSAIRRSSPDEYLVLERRSETKHEYVDGHIVAMAGGSRTHSVIAANTIRLLGNELAPKGCQIYSSDMRIGIARRGYFYPDLSVVCGTAETEDDLDDVLLNPVLIVEVLSPSTAAFDRGDKFQKYRTIPSLKVFVLISQHKPFVEVYERKDFNRWEATYAESIDATIQLPVVDVSLKLQELYQFVSFPAPDANFVGEAPVS